MIIAEEKPIEEILAQVKDTEKVLVISCASCEAVRLRVSKKMRRNWQILSNNMLWLQVCHWRLKL